MAYQVLARKWRPQRFDDVVGQGGVTRVLRNAITSGRIAQAFVFAGPRGVGKTTSARIFARALNCVNGPTPDPCGVCESCVEIAEGRDMDVLEIDAATHTGVDKVREVIISGLSIPPVRDRYKIFIIDEVHQLSSSSFNALLKSVEEPPPHVVFIMATTELAKIPETIISRSQVHDFHTITLPEIAGQLRKISTAEGLDVSDEALTLVARAADGSMRDGLTAFDQVVAFAGTTITATDVADVLGIVGRDLLYDIMTAVAEEQAAAAFDLAARAVSSGNDLRMLCRELARLVRDLLLVSVDRNRMNDPEVVPAGERERFEAVGKFYSREDLLRAFDLLARTEADLRTAAEPRYHLEMALLKWIHLRKLVPLADLLQQLQAGGGAALRGGQHGPSSTSGGAPSGFGASSSAARRPGPPERSTMPSVPPPPARPAMPAGTPAAPARPTPGAGTARTTAAIKAAMSGASSTAARPVSRPPAMEPDGPPGPEPPPPDDEYGSTSSVPGGLKESFLAEIRKQKAAFFQMTVAQAYSIDVQGDRIVFSFTPIHGILKAQLEQNKTWLEPLASQLAGRRILVASQTVDPKPGAPRPAPAIPDLPEPDEPVFQGGGEPEADNSSLKAEALADPAMKTLLELIPAEIKDVKKM